MSQVKPDMSMDINLPNIGEIEVRQNAVGLFKVTFKPLREEPVEFTRTLLLIPGTVHVRVRITWKAGDQVRMWMNGDFVGQKPFNPAPLQ